MSASRYWKDPSNIYPRCLWRSLRNLDGNIVSHFFHEVSDKTGFPFEKDVDIYVDLEEVADKKSTKTWET